MEDIKKDSSALQQIPQDIIPVVTAPAIKKYIIMGVLVVGVLLIAGGSVYFFGYKKIARNATSSIIIATSTAESSPIAFQQASVKVPFVRQSITINPSIAEKFTLSEVKNIPDMEKAYGITFSKNDLASLEKNKFIIKNLLDTNIAKDEYGLSSPDPVREFVALYQRLSGSSDYRERTQANALFISSDSMMNLFSILSADLLKESENSYLYDQTLSITKVMYEQSSIKVQEATSTEQKKEWSKVRNYFAVPYALLSTSAKPITAQNYFASQYYKEGVSLEKVQADFLAQDKNADSYEKSQLFVQSLKLPQDDEKVILASLKQSYEAAGSGVPFLFADEFRALPPPIEVKVPFTLFKPRGTYTSSSLRRQYFRAVQWYQQVPFLLASNDLTRYALDIGLLVESNQEVKKQHTTFSSFIAFIVGESDDLDVVDYAAAIKDLGALRANDRTELVAYLAKRKPDAKIKGASVNISSGSVTVKDEMDVLRGMRFMSSKFIPDSYWTSRLTQGDEAPDVNGFRLSDKASSLQIMSLLGSPYATSHLPDLSFYAGSKQAMIARLGELKTEKDGWSDTYWQSNLYTSTLWSISGMFSWLQMNRQTLPQFMQSPLWDSKTLLTASGFWTELRHTSLLYAKQSFAEKGGGGGDCDTRTIPAPPKGYIEPQAESYDRLSYTAHRLLAEYTARGYKLQNLPRLEEYIKLLDVVREYSKFELENTAFTEATTTETFKMDGEKDCTENYFAPETEIKSDDGYTSVSRWEDIRVGLVNRMQGALPLPVEGPIMQIKDKRAAVVADIHTDKGGGVLEEGTGVPRLIFVAVKDSNGPRLTVGVTYSQYEFISGDRMTDEDWQEKFYTNKGGDSSITYKPKNSWPTINTWFQELLGTK